MTIRNDTLSLADWVAGYARQEQGIPQHATVRLLDALLDLADRARLLEDATIHAHERPDAA
jgi:hypothetical protein